MMMQCQAAKSPLHNIPWEKNEHSPLTPAHPFFPCENISGSSFRFYCTFELQTHFFSGRDRAGQKKASGDHDTSIPNNHLCRDWISGSPLAKAGAWKRLFRTYWPENAGSDLDRLFGPETEELEAEKNPKKPFKAELKFHHASFFPLSSTDTALIAPRDPESGKVAHGPITYEVVKKGSRCEVVIDYLPRIDGLREEDASPMAEQVLKNVFLSARAAEKQGAAIGGKSGIWGRIRLTACSVQTGPDVPRTVTSCIKSRESFR
jgi:hypothetical protein